MAILDSAGRPIHSGRYVPKASLDAGNYRGTIANWRPAVTGNTREETSERGVAQRRAADLFANDWGARSGIRSIADNAVGTGLVPKSAIPHKILGISREDAAAIGEKMEWAFADWSPLAHANGFCHFEDLQYLGLLSILRLGEMLHLPVMLRDKDRAFSLAIQNLSPSRLYTPSDKGLELYIRDGVEVSAIGKPVAYWIACPEPSFVSMTNQDFLLSADFARRPARVGHRPNVFHLFRHEFDEQIRGVSALACGMKLYRNLNDCLDSELLAQVIAASFPVFIEMENGTANLPDAVRENLGYGAPDHAERIQEIDAGTIMYGQPGEKPHILESNRPSSNFAAFEVTIKRCMAAALGIPYESLSKDFSKTNYSSMRAALNEAWKVYDFYRKWFARLYTQPVWEMVIEEAYLRNHLGLADDIDGLGAEKGFYEGLKYWTSATWIGPAKGFVDPVKEITATILALQNRLITYGEAWAERGGDFADALPVMQEEIEQLGELAPALQSASATGGGATDSSQKDLPHDRGGVSMTDRDDWDEEGKPARNDEDDEEEQP